METGPLRWVDALPRPLAFVLSGGASLGATQVGMLEALDAAGIRPDLLVGTSVGTLNAAVVAQHGSIAAALPALREVWTRISRREVFPGGILRQALSVRRTGHVYPRTGLERVVDALLDVTTFEELQLPLTVVAADVLTAHVRRFTEGDLRAPLLAATAIPGVFPPVEIEGRVYWDAGPVANVPLRSATGQGAASIVVLDVGDVCHLSAPPRGVPDAMLMAASIAMRQRIMLEAPQVAMEVPLLYLPRPCVSNRPPLDLETSQDLIEPARQVVEHFLETATVPVAGCMAGAPHHHTA